ncbi:lactose/L-arabinose transport system permease protein [Caloramator proteoclasticus DSM 10124]|uniref:Lactose/L-arabinose transport system permease protein n=2 Tax=Caloramator TaxID=44258 RepID=A0A1M4TPY6_9CLOT|nr:lactose/L-arabinose transport system permease protein [Caloramator proteoclasticus DSM 10124]
MQIICIIPLCELPQLIEVVASWSILKAEQVIPRSKGCSFPRYTIYMANFSLVFAIIIVAFFIYFRNIHHPLQKWATSIAVYVKSEVLLMQLRKATKSYERSLDRYGWLFISIAVILLAVFMFYPIIYSLILSTMSSKGIVQKFVGLGNYKKLIKDEMFIKALKNTFIFLIIQVPIMLLLALILAAILNDKTIKFRGLFRTGIFLPAVTSLVAYTILFKMMFSVDGFINLSLMRLHIIKQPIPWLMDPFWAKVTVIIAMTWRWTGYNMVFYLSGLQSVPDELYEAAEIDGASKMQQFFHITIPMLKPIIVFTTIMSTIGTLQLFDEPMNLSQGGVTGATTGPGNSLLTLSVYIYNLCFKYMPNFGYAATIAYVIVFIVAILSFIQFKVAGDKE